jgi:hypothetical protein
MAGSNVPRSLSRFIQPRSSEAGGVKGIEPCTKAWEAFGSIVELRPRCLHPSNTRFCSGTPVPIWSRAAV